MFSDFVVLIISAAVVVNSGGAFCFLCVCVDLIFFRGA